MCALSVVSAWAYDVKVIVENAGTHQRLMDYTPQAFSTDGSYSVVATAKPVPADTTFMFKGLPDNIALHLGVIVDGNLFSELVSEPRDTMVMSLPAYAFAQQLQEVVVKGDSRYVTDEKTVFLPTKRDKKISAGGVELLNALAMPTIKVNPADNSVQTVTGEGVTFYIDYVPATMQDVQNIRTMDVVRVEVFDYPKDPVFMGAGHVINYVLVKYEYGGYTKLSANQRFGMNEGNYGVASKFAVKKMTFDLAGGFDYYNTNNMYSNSQTWYKFAEGDLTREQTTTDARQSRRSGYATLRAIYRTDKSTISNTFGFAGTNAPGNYTNLLTTYTPPLYDVGNAMTRTGRSTFSLSWKGFYQWLFNNGYSLVITPGAAYSRYNNKSSYLYNTDNKVINNALDKSWNYEVYVEGQKQVRSHSFGLAASTNVQGNVIRYTGTTPSSVHTSQIISQLRFIANLKFYKLWFQGNLSLRHQYNKLNDEVRNFVQPHIYAIGGMTINSRQSVLMAMEYAIGQIPLPELSPTIIQTNNIDAARGNPDLNRFNMFNIMAQYQYMFSNELSAAVYCNFHRDGSLITSYYTEGVGATYPIMIRNITNSGFLNNFSYGANVTARLLNNNLTLQAGLSSTSATRHGIMNYKGDYLTFNANAIYSISGWYTSVFYNYRNKSCQAWGYYNMPEYYGLEVGWGNANWNISAKLNNPFRKSMFSASTLTYTDNYWKYNEQFTARDRCNFRLNVVYSFSYGKKVQRGNEAGKVSGSGSAILE